MIIKKCKICGTVNDIDYYEICKLDTDKILVKGIFCLKHITDVMSKNKSSFINHK
jgi:hypothetical protein